MKTEQLLISPKEAAQIMGCSEKHIRDLCIAGKIKAIKSGDCWRINKAAFFEYCEL